MSKTTIKSADAVEIHGYITDPKRAGFQVLTNYECVYWRALIGNDAWGLYEVLRSFCHAGVNSCYPSIRYLTDILGFKDKRALIGRRKTVKGKEYEFPGTIEVLQEYRLIVAEVRGDSPQMRYIFHVNLTPGMLTDTQVRQLPSLLTEKHGVLLDRIDNELRKLQSKKKAKRFSGDSDDVVEPESNAKSPAMVHEARQIGGGKFPQGERENPKRGVGNSHPNNTKLSKPKDQHQQRSANIKKPEIVTNGGRNKTVGDDEMVNLLLSFEVTKPSAKQLVNQYSKERIQRQVRNLRHRTDKGEPIKGNRGGKLRSMIENDWPFPGDYRSPEEIAKEEKRKEKLIARSNAESAKQRQNRRASQQEREKLIQDIREEMGMADDICDSWESRKKSLGTSLKPQEFMLIGSTYLLGVVQNVAVLGVNSSYNQDRLKVGKLHAALKHELSQILPEITEVEVVILNEVLAKMSSADGPEILGDAPEAV